MSCVSISLLLSFALISLETRVNDYEKFVQTDRIGLTAYLMVKY